MNSFLPVKRENLSRILQAFQDGTAAEEAIIKPLLLHLEITTRCNLRCLKCGHATDPPGTARIAPRHLQYRIIETCDDFFAAAVRVHAFGYGEMFLYSKLQLLVERLKHHGVMVDGITNGVLLGEKEIDWLVDYGFDELTLSIDGVEPATMQRLRGVDVEALWKSLAYMKRRKKETGKDRPRIVVNFVAQKDNFHELPALVRKLADLDIFFLGVNPLFAVDEDAYEDAYALHYREFTLRHVPREFVESALAEARQIAQQAHLQYATYMDLDAIYKAEPANRGFVQLVQQWDGSAKREEKLPAYYCAYPWTSMYVHADQGSRVCCYMDGSMGTVNSGDDLQKVWSEGLITEIRSAVAKGEVHQACKLCVRDGRYTHSYVDLEDIKRQVKLESQVVEPLPEAVEAAF